MRSNCVLRGENNELLNREEEEEASFRARLDEINHQTDDLSSGLVSTVDVRVGGRVIRAC